MHTVKLTTLLLLSAAAAAANAQERDMTLEQERDRMCLHEILDLKPL